MLNLKFKTKIPDFFWGGGKLSNGLKKATYFFQADLLYLLQPVSNQRNAMKWYEKYRLLQTQFCSHTRGRKNSPKLM